MTTKYRPGDPPPAWRVGEFRSSADPEKLVLLLATGAEIGIYESHRDFIRWVHPAAGAGADAAGITDGQRMFGSLLDDVKSRQPFKLNPPPVYDVYYAGTQEGSGGMINEHEQDEATSLEARATAKFANCKYCGLEREDAGPAKGCPTGWRCAHLNAEDSKAMHDNPELFEARKRVSRLLADRGIYLYYTAIDEVIVAARPANVNETWVTQALRLIDAYKTAPGSKTEAAADAMIAHLRTVNAGAACLRCNDSGSARTAAGEDWPCPRCNDGDGVGGTDAD
jgi:hypothetical protein